MRLSILWRIMEIEEGVIRLGLQPQPQPPQVVQTLVSTIRHWITHSPADKYSSKSEEVDLLFAKSKKRKHYILVYASTLAKSSICDRKFSYFYISYRKRTWLNSLLFTTIPKNSEKNDVHTWIILIAPIMWFQYVTDHFVTQFSVYCRPPYI